MHHRYFALFNNGGRRVGDHMVYSLPDEFTTNNKGERKIQVLQFNFWRIDHNLSALFDHVKGARLHASFNFDSPEYDRFVMVENNSGSFVHKKEYIYRSNRREIEVWFTDPLNNTLDLWDENLDRWNAAWYIELLLSYNN